MWGGGIGECKFRLIDLLGLVVLIVYRGAANSINTREIYTTKRLGTFKWASAGYAYLKSSKIAFQNRADGSVLGLNIATKFPR